jgi:hypothetical protein
MLSTAQVAHRLAERVPFGWTHPEGHDARVAPPGVLTPSRAAYAVGQERIELPTGVMPMHGMTGCSSASVAHDRLDTMIESGGLLSIAERTRRGIRLRSMSPLGDIASGIDGGVPCSILPTPSHGDYYHFVLSPRLLERRDLWFSDRDFGGGDSRYDRYTTYANKIGQRRIWDEPSHESRKRHLATGIESSTNEVYCRDSVGLHEIDTVLLTFENRDEYVRGLEALAAHKRAGRLPAHVRAEATSVSERKAGFARLLPYRGQRVSARSQAWHALT